MNTKLISSCAALLALGYGALSQPPAAIAGGFNPMNAMNPTKWFGGGNNDRYYDDDYYGGPPPGYGGGPWGGGPYGRGPGYGYGGYPGGWGGGYPGYPGYGAGAPGYGAPAPGYGAPAAPGYAEPTPSAKELAERIEKLEVEQQRKAYQTPPPPAPVDNPPASDPGGFRPYTGEDNYSSGYQPYSDSKYQSPQLWR